MKLTEAEAQRVQNSRYNADKFGDIEKVVNEILTEHVEQAERKLFDVMRKSCCCEKNDKCLHESGKPEYCDYAECPIRKGEEK